MGLFDNAELPVPCSKCGNSTKKTIGWIKTHDKLTCACGTIINIDADGLIKADTEANEAVADVKRTLEELQKGNKR